jgi:chromosome partitioning protein
MKTLTILSRKGGAGKTTLSVHLAALAQSQGLCVALIDLDPQESALIWNSKRDDALRLHMATKLPTPAGFDLCIVDTPPHSDKTAALAAGAADFVLIPARPAQFDLDALPSTLEICRLARKKCAVVLNAVPHNNRQGADAADALREGRIPMIPDVITQYVAFSHAVIDGRAVHEFDPAGKAAGQIRGLFDWLRKEMQF